MLLSEERMAHFFDLFQSGPIEARFETDDEFFSIHMAKIPGSDSFGMATVEQWRILGTPEQILEEICLEQAAVNIKYLTDHFSIRTDSESPLIGVCRTDTFDVQAWTLLSNRLHLLEQQIEVEKELIENDIKTWSTRVIMDDLRFQMKMELEDD